MDRRPASDLIQALKSAGVAVEHSPSNPLDQNDPRWGAWYKSGLTSSLQHCQVFIIVVDFTWDSSTWMGEEARVALVSSPDSAARQAFFWNPDGIEVRGAGRAPHLREELPKDLNEAVARITQSV